MIPSVDGLVTDDVVMNDLPEIAGGRVIAELERTTGGVIGVGSHHAQVRDQIRRMLRQPAGEQVEHPGRRPPHLQQPFLRMERLLWIASRKKT